MQQRTLGNSGIHIAPFAFGGNVFGWTVDEATSFSLLDAFVDAGFNLIDTADCYSAWVEGNSGGESETIIGNWLRQSGRRNDVVMATKVAKWKRFPGLALENIRAAAEGSLQRLGVETIDVYFSHEDDPKVPIADTLGAYARLIEEGKVRAIGASNFSAARLAESLDISKREGLPRYEVLQPEYNLMERGGYERELEPLVREHNLGVTSYFALASGFLTGKYRDEGHLTRSARGNGVRKYLDTRGKAVLSALDEVAARHRAKPAQVALAWVMAQPGISAPIASATSLDQLDELIGAAQLSLSTEDIAALDRASE
ncbi:MAG: aldo/keto reductase [Dokdonella sp.]